MRLTIDRFVLLAFVILLFSGCAAINEGRVRVDYERYHRNVTVIVDGVPAKTASGGDGDVLVEMPKGKHHIVVSEIGEIVLDTVVEVKNAYGASSWLSWSLGGFMFCASLAFGWNILYSTFVLFAPPLFISEDDVKIPIRGDVRDIDNAVLQRNSSDGSEVRYLGDAGLTMQIAGESAFVNMQTNGMALSNIKVFCHVAESQKILVKSDDGRKSKMLDYASARVCSGSKASLVCEEKGFDFWNQYPCK